MELKGFAGLFVSAIVLAGILTYLYQSNLQATDASFSQIYSQEISANRIAEAKTAIMLSHRLIDPKNEMAWRAAVQQDLASHYGFSIFFDDSIVPVKVVIIDPASRMQAEFYLF